MSDSKIGFIYIDNVQNNSFVNASCKFCKENIDIKERIIVRHWFNTKHRGSETEFYEFFHRKCSEDSSKWITYDEKEKLYAQIDELNKECYEKMYKIEADKNKKVQLLNAKINSIYE